MNTSLIISFYLYMTFIGSSVLSLPLLRHTRQSTDNEIPSLTAFKTAINGINLLYNNFTPDDFSLLNEWDTIANTVALMFKEQANLAKTENESIEIETMKVILDASIDQSCKYIIEASSNYSSHPLECNQVEFLKYRVVQITDELLITMVDYNHHEYYCDWFQKIINDNKETGDVNITTKVEESFKRLAPNCRNIQFD